MVRTVLGWLPEPTTPGPARLRLAFETLGPVYIKLGQMLSTRRDLLPPDVVNELQTLQDHVPPFSGELAKTLVEQALDNPLSANFSTFSLEPLASASVAQVHAATLIDDQRVVVKIVRPDIADIIRDDMQLLKQFAERLESVSDIGRRLHLSEVIRDYERTITQELDMLSEAANTTTLRYNFAESPLLYAPRVYDSLCRNNVLVMERIHGVPIANVDELKRQGTDLRLLAERGVETFFTQVFVHNFFHADMHPGNIFVDTTDPSSPSYIAIDCAIIGSLTDDDMNYLAQNLLAFFNQDYAAVVRLHLESGWIPADTDAVAFERVIREACEPIFAKPLNEIVFSEFIVTLFRTAADFNMEVQPQLVLLQKTLLYIEGLGRQLYPQLDLWVTAKPFMEQWMAQRTSPTNAVRAFIDNAPALMTHLPQLPKLIINTSSQLKRLDREVAQQRKQVAHLQASVQRLRGRRWLRFAGIGFVAFAAVLLWQPLAVHWREQVAAGGPAWLTTAALASAIVGSLLLLRS